MKYLFSMIYSLSQISLGLILHPYQTMQSLVQDKIFVWMTLLPSLILALVTVIWRLIIVPFVQGFFSCHSATIPVCEILPYLSNTITFFCIYWQIILFYLLIRFKKAFG